MIDQHGGCDVLAATNIVFAAGLVCLSFASDVATLAFAWVMLGIGMGFGLYEAAFATAAGLYGREARNAITGITVFRRAILTHLEGGSGRLEAATREATADRAARQAAVEPLAACERMQTATAFDRLGAKVMLRLPHGMAPQSFQRKAGHIARHADPWDRGPDYGVQYGASIENMTCIPHCTP
jgi:hypothetical protein